jgi:hypothetical protein
MDCEKYITKITLCLIAKTLRVPCKIDGNETNQCTRQKYDGRCRFIIAMWWTLMIELLPKVVDQVRG